MLPSQLRPLPATLRELLGRAPELQEVADALFDAVRVEVDPSATPLTRDEVDAIDTRRLADTYRSAEWTWRR